MKKVPIVFSFDDNYVMPAGVCITSLLKNSHKDTFYDIFIFHSSSRLSNNGKEQILRLRKVYNNCEFSFVDVKDTFKDAFEIRNVTIDSYYRLLIPKYIKNHDGVIYSDVDVIFKGDLSHLLEIDMKGKSVGAVRVPLTNAWKKYSNSLSINPEKYFNPGLLLMNLKKIINENSMDKIESLIKNKYTYQDQDILNILYSEDSIYIGDEYCLTSDRLKENIFLEPIIYHYTGKKPWEGIVFFGDIWWEYYRQSIYFDLETYNKFQMENIMNLDRYIKAGVILKKTGLFKIRLLLKNILRIIFK